MPFAAHTGDRLRFAHDGPVTCDQRERPRMIRENLKPFRPDYSASIDRRSCKMVLAPAMKPANPDCASRPSPETGHLPRKDPQNPTYGYAADSTARRLSYTGRLQSANSTAMRSFAGTPL